MKYRRCTNGGYQRRAGGAAENCCSCFCRSSDGTDFTVAGAPYNAGYTVLRIGGTGNPAAPFPLFPRFSVKQQTILPSVSMWRQGAFLMVYPMAVKSGGTYTVNERCRNIYATYYMPAKCLTGGGAYGSGNNTIQPPHATPWTPPHPRGLSYVRDAYTTFRSTTHPTGTKPRPHSHTADPLIQEAQPQVWGASGGTRIEGRFADGFGGGITDLSWFALSPTDLATVAGFSSAADGVPHTLILYMNFWRSAYKTLIWNHACVPAWWASGPSPIGTDYDTGTVPKSYYSTDPAFLDSNGDVYGYPSWKNHRGGHHAGGSNTGARLGTDAFDPTTDADCRAILLGVHTTNHMHTVYINDNITISTGSGPFHVVPPNFSAHEGFQSNVFWNGDTIDLSASNVNPLSLAISITAMCKQAIGLVPVSGAAWMAVGTPVTVGCLADAYSVTLTFTGHGTTTLTIGDSVFTIIK